MARLIVIDGPDRGRELEIPSSGGTVGRGETCAIRLGDGAISREHFRLEVDREQITVVDLGSTNRTRVNGEPVTERVLVPGDVIAAGKSLIQLVPEGHAATLGGESRVTVEVDASAAARTVGQGGDAPRLARYLAAMTAIGEAVHGAAGRDAAVAAGTARLRDALGADRVTIVIDRDGALVPLGDGGPVVPLGRELVDRVLAAGRAAAASDAGRELAVAPLPGPSRAGGLVIAERAAGPWDRIDVELLAAAAHVLAAGLGAIATSDRLSRDRRALRERAEPDDFLGDSPGAAAIREFVARVSATESTVLILGESGVGKELVATAVHRQSRRAAGPLVIVNCAALTDTLLETELFGHEKGAFTGATERRAGRFEQADGGTIFLDEIGELSPRCQAKLLRVLEDRRVERVGGVTVPIDVRVVAATHRDLAAMVRAGELRQDLYFRLEVLVGTVPPLRDRRADLPAIAERFLQRFAAQAGRRRRGFTREALARLATHPWPGNVRELRNVVERIAVLGDSDPVSDADVARALGASFTVPAATVEVRSLDDVERDAVTAAYQATGGNKLRAAELLGIDRTTLYKKLKRYGLD